MMVMMMIDPIEIGPRKTFMHVTWNEDNLQWLLERPHIHPIKEELRGWGASVTHERKTEQLAYEIDRSKSQPQFCINDNQTDQHTEQGQVLR